MGFGLGLGLGLGLVFETPLHTGSHFMKSFFHEKAFLNFIQKLNIVILKIVIVIYQFVGFGLKFGLGLVSKLGLETLFLKAFSSSCLSALQTGSPFSENFFFMKIFFS